METKGVKRTNFFDDKIIEELHMKAKYGAPYLAKRIPPGKSIGTYL